MARLEGYIPSMFKSYLNSFPKLLCALALSVVFLSGTVHAQTTIEWWQFWTDPTIKPLMDSVVTEFEKANPGVTVKLTDLTWSNGHEKIVIALSSGTGPDILELGSDWIAQFAENDQLEILSGNLMGDDSAEYDGWSMAAYNGKVYARPWILGTRVLFLNRDMMNKTGFRPDFLPTQWLQLAEIAKRANNLGKDIYGWGSNRPEKHRLYKKFLPFLWSNKGRFFSEDGKFCVISSTFAVNALIFYKKLHDSYGFVGSQREIDDAFLDGKIGAIMSGDWLLKRIALERRKINFSTAPMPGPNFLGRSFMGGEFLAINAASSHKKLAAEFMSFVTSPENQLRFCKANLSTNPSSKTAQRDDYFKKNEQAMTFIRQLRSSDHPPVIPQWVIIEKEIEAAVEDALFGSGKPASALRRAQINITRAMKR